MSTPELKTNEQSLDSIARLVDASGDSRTIDGIDHALELASQLLSRELSEEEFARCHYYMANAWSHKRSLVTPSASTWEWESQETEEEVFHLRSALSVRGSSKLPPDLFCSSSTNLGNLLSRVGRVVEAIAYWNEALRKSPSFAMAMGNRGIGFTKYAEYLYDHGHSLLLLRQAHTDLAAINKCRLHASAKQAFDQYRARIESVVSAKQLAHRHDLDSFVLGSTQQEISYRKWCLANCLFLNPLNDLGEHAIAASVVLPIYR